jgi:hypothetical protein
MLPFLAITAIVTVGMQLLFFIIAATFKFDKVGSFFTFSFSCFLAFIPQPLHLQVTDLAGSANFVVLALLTFFLNHTYHARQIIITVLVCVWGARLGTFLFIRVLRVSDCVLLLNQCTHPLKLFLVSFILCMICSGARMNALMKSVATS